MSSFLHPRVDGYWMEQIGPFGEVSYAENWLHGCEQAAWSMQARTRHHALHPGATTQIFEGGFPVFTGYLAEPGGDGTFEAIGWWKLGEGVAAIDSGGAVTADPDTAAIQARLRGAVPWAQPFNLDAGPYGDPDTGLTLNSLLDRYSEVTNLKWRVDHAGNLVVSGDPAGPSWAMRVAEEVWTTSIDDYVTHINVTYMGSISTFPTFVYSTADSNLAASMFGRVEKSLDLTGFGIITLATAQAYAASVLAASGPRMVLTEPIVLATGQLRTLGDTPAGWSGVRAGQSIRLWGVTDRGSVAAFPYTDMPIGQLARNRTTLTLTAQGAPPRRTDDVIAAITAAAAA